MWFLTFAIFISSAEEDFEYFDTDHTVISKYNGDVSNVLIPAKVRVIQTYAFENSNALQIYFEQGSQLYSVDNDAFSGSEIEIITFPNVNLAIGYAMFRGASKLKNLVFPGPVRSIGDHAFSETTLLSDITIAARKLVANFNIDLSEFPDLELADSCFADSHFKKITIPYETIPTGFLSNMIYLETAVIVAPIKEIPQSLFRYCSSIKNIIVNGTYLCRDGNLSLYGSPIKRIGSGSFHGAGILYVYIPADFEFVDRLAFTLCSKVIEIVNLMPFEKWPEPDLDGTASLVNLTVGKFQIIRNKILDYSGTNVTFINSHDFSGSDIQEIILPESVVDLYSDAFSFSSIKKATLGSNIKFTSYAVFEGCYSLSYITVGSKAVLNNGVLDFSGTNVKVIYSATFRSIPTIQKLVISSGLNVMRAAFQNCTNLLRIEIQASDFTLAEGSLIQTYNLACIEFTGVTCSTLPAANYSGIFSTSESALSSKTGWCDLTCSTPFTTTFVPLPETTLYSNQDTSKNGGSTSDTASSSSGISGGVVALIVIVIILVIAAIAVGIFFVVVRKGKSHEFNTQLM